MFSLVIVEDESEIRNGLKNYFPWNTLGLAVVADYDNGASALEYIRLHKIDVLLTDVRMPMMDGLSLIEKAKELQPSLIPVILSGYQDFSYAQRSIALGVKEYLVKPTKYDELKRVFTKITNHLMAQKEGKEPKEIPQSQLMANIQRYIDENLSSVTLDSLSDVFSFNPYYVSTLFHARSGEKFSDYVNRKRMTKASELLTTTRISIQEIARQVGYENASSFGRCFKLFFHQSPKEYREQHENNRQR